MLKTEQATCRGCVVVRFQSTVSMKSSSLPEWANEAINESCQGKSWQTLINSIQQHLKHSSSVPKEKMTKRFSEYHELEQAVLVEQELREVWYFDHLEPHLC
jgi:hypothetical protein